VTEKVACNGKTGIRVTDDRNGHPSKPKKPTRQHKPKATDELKISEKLKERGTSPDETEKIADERAPVAPGDPRPRGLRQNLR